VIEAVCRRGQSPVVGAVNARQTGGGKDESCQGKGAYEGEKTKGNRKFNRLTGNVQPGTQIVRSSMDRGKKSPRSVFRTYARYGVAGVHTKKQSQGGLRKKGSRARGIVEDGEFKVIHRWDRGGVFSKCV